MSTEANMATEDKFFKVGAWVTYFSAAAVILCLILILSRNYVAGQVIISLGSILFPSSLGKTSLKELRTKVID